MVAATATSSYQNHTFFSNFLSSSPYSNLFPLHVRCLKRQSVTSDFTAARIRCKAAVGSTETKLQKKSQYDIENLIIWLLKQEQAGNNDAELTIVLSSISLACKQIASLLRRSSIINLTGAHGTINIQVVLQLPRSCGRTGIIASEEEDVPVAVEETYSGNYILTDLPTLTPP